MNMATRCGYLICKNLAVGAASCEKQAASSALCVHCKNRRENGKLPTKSCELAAQPSLVKICQ